MEMEKMRWNRKDGKKIFEVGFRNRREDENIR